MLVNKPSIYQADFPHSPPSSLLHSSTSNHSIFPPILYLSRTSTQLLTSSSPSQTLSKASLFSIERRAKKRNTYALFPLLLSTQRSKRPLLVFLSASRKAFEKSSPALNRSQSGLRRSSPDPHQPLPVDVPERHHRKHRHEGRG
jgi:hypothetical protein